ncbi:MAG TPA: ABC transporter permease subunit [Phycisphaerae bacterium]|nr:ABC transporter permease subunit [Phycisphaerae bacterium]HRY69080.1 ABC transporter permease subunit [Phycisphaerae bacterium]HSA25945.1 ABC transporter permease subunit [Phycisphaerae bacterium]
MNRGLLAKSLRDVWFLTLLLGAGLGLAEALLARALPRVQEQIGEILSQLVFVQRILQALLGTNISGGLGPEMIGALAWVHPVVLALVWAHAIAYCTLVPAGEVDRGTIDMLLGLPVSRWQVYVAGAVVWLAAGVVLMLAAVIGHLIGCRLSAEGLRLDPRPLTMVVVNLFSLYVAVGGLAWLISTMSDRRGRSVGWVLAFVLASFLLNFLGQFWPLADRLSFLSLLHYYNPLSIIRSGRWPVGDILVLLGLGSVLWTVGGFVFARRDLSTL